MTKNSKLLYSLIAFTLFLILAGSGIVFFQNSNISNLWKTDQQKWEEFKPILKNDSSALNNWLVKDTDVANKHYPIVKNIDCGNLNDFKNQSNCNLIKNITIKKIERPDEIKRGDKYTPDEYQSIMISAESI
jgi:hypothetical protein